MENLPLDLLAIPIMGGRLVQSHPHTGEDTQVIDFMGILSNQTTRITDQENGLGALGGLSLPFNGTPADTPAATAETYDEEIPQTALMDVLAALPVIAPPAPAIPVAPLQQLQYPAPTPPNITLDTVQADACLSVRAGFPRQTPSPLANPVSAPTVDATTSTLGPVESDVIHAAAPAAQVAPIAALASEASAETRPTAFSEHADSTAFTLHSSAPTRTASDAAPAPHAKLAQSMPPVTMPSPVVENAALPASSERAAMAATAPVLVPATASVPAMAPLTQASPLGGALTATRPAPATPFATPFSSGRDELAISGAADKNPAASDHGNAVTLMTPVAHPEPVDRDKVLAPTHAPDLAVAPAAISDPKETDTALPQAAVQPSLTAASATPTPQAALMPAVATAPRAEITPPPAPYAAPMAHIYVETPVHAAGWSSALGERVAWLMDHGQHKARLHIDPEHLGPIDVTLTLRGNEVGITFSTAQAELRGALDLALPQLRDTLAQGGVQLGNTTVSSGSQGSGQDASGATARQRGYTAASAQAETAPAALPTRTSLGLLDTYA